GLTRKTFRGSSLVLALIVSPMIVPVIVTAVGTYFMFAKFGLVATFSGLVIAHTVLGVPFVVITVSSTLQTFDNRLLQAACGLGASPTHAFFTIVLPIIANGVIAGAIFAFVTSFDDVVVAIFIGGPQQKTLPRQMFEGIKDNIDPSILAMSAILLLVTILLMVFLSLLRRR
ncbi:MAG: ABC transporter permease, partial [Mesorhizobium sp.]